MLTAPLGGVIRVHFNQKNFKIWDPERAEAVEQKCVKIEKFFLDFYGLVSQQVYIEVERREEFAPIKNKEGANDTPLTAYALYTQRNLRWAAKAGFQVVQSSASEYFQVAPDLFMNDWLWAKMATPSTELKLPAYLE